MAKLVWDQSGQRFYETGVKMGVLYVQDASGTYPKGVAWNGLTAVNETPSGAEATPLYADDIKYLNLRSAEAITFSWEVNCTPVEVAGFKPTASLVIDSTKVDAEKLAALEAKLYGDESTEAMLPLPAEIAEMFKGA
jgi:hypothetical protein